MNTWQIFLVAAGLMLVIEGAFYFALPDASRRFLKMLLLAKVGQLRRFGMIAIVLGLGLIWFASTI